MKIALGPLLFVATVGCSMSRGPSKDSVLVVPDEVVADVSSDQTLLASYASAALAGPGPLGGTLRVRPLPVGDPVFEVAGAFGATFGQQGTTLLYFTSATADLDAGQQLIDFGHPWLWSPAFGSTPAPLAAGFVTLWTATPDHSLVLFVESMNPGVDQTLRLLRTADCVGGSTGDAGAPTCPTTPVVNMTATPANPQVPQIVRIVIAPDGLHAAYQAETKNSDGSRAEAITLVSVADGSTTPVSTTPVPATMPYVGDLFSFSPDGSLLATVIETANGPLHTMMASTATGAPVPWGPQPADLFCTQVGFSDSQTMFLAAVDKQLNGQIWRTTVNSTQFFTEGSAFTLSHTYPGTERYFAFTDAGVAALASGAPHDLQVADLTANPLTSFPVTAAGNGTLTFSQDVSSAFTYEGFESFTQTGTLVQVALPAGTVTNIDANVYTGGTSFARGSSKILYFPSTDTRKSSGQPIVEWDGTGTQLEGFALNYVSVDNPPTLFWTLADPRALYRRPLP